MKKGAKIGLVIFLVIAVPLVVWFATAPIREAKERTDYQASIKTVQGAIKGYIFKARYFGFSSDYTEVDIEKEDGQTVTLLIDKRLRSLLWHSSLPKGAKMFTVSEESSLVYIDGTSKDDIYSFTYAGTGKIKDLLKIKQVQSRTEIIRDLVFGEKLPDLEKWAIGKVYEYGWDPDQDGIDEAVIKSISHPKGYAWGEAFYDLTGEKPVLRMVRLLFEHTAVGSCKVWVRENGEWKVGMTAPEYVSYEYSKERNRFEFDIPMIPLKDYKEQRDRMEEKSSL